MNLAAVILRVESPSAAQAAEYAFQVFTSFNICAITHYDMA